MMRQTPQRKLEALRLQTDRQLVALMNHRLQRGFTAAARTRHGSCEWYDEVSAVCSEVGRLLPLVESISRAEKARMQSRLGELEGMLDYARVQAAS